MSFRSLVSVALIFLVVSACALVDPVDTRYDTVGRSLAKARNESIFLNLVRASHDYPLSFTTIANVTPTMTNVSSLALPSFLIGPGSVQRVGTTVVSTFPSTSPFRDAIFGSSTASDSTSVSTNFNVATQETSAFYLGFLKPIDLHTLDYFIRQGYSRELLFWLFADSVELSDAGRKLGMRYEPPKDYGCNRNDPRHLCFPDLVLIAIAAGLTVEELTVRTERGAARRSEDGKDSGTKGESIIFARFCFDPILARRSQNEMGPRWQNSNISRAFNLELASPKCGSHWDPVKEAEKPQPDTLNFDVGPHRFRVVPRSAYGVFAFLGQLMKVQREEVYGGENPYVPPDRLDIIQPPLLATVHDDAHLITVLPNDAPDCFVHTWFFDGDYCVPQSAATTKHIFGLLAQLIAIQTSATDLSITPVVRVIQ